MTTKKMKAEQKTKTLYPYQWEAVLDLSEWAISGERRLALVMPTGAGKSLVISAILERISGRFTSAVVATPLNTIKSAFQGIGDIVDAEIAQADGSVGSYIGDLRELYHTASVASAADTFKTHLKAAKPARFGLVVSHTGLRDWSDSLPKDLTGKILVIDEAHHADMTEDDMTELGVMSDTWYERGGVVLLVTATPFRGNGIPLFAEEDGWKVHTRTLVEHAADLGISFPLERFALRSKADKVSQMDGRDTLGSDAEEWAAKWDTDGQPKSVFIVPTNASRAWSEKLVSCLLVAAPGVRIHNAVGVAVKQQKELNKLLDAERAVKNYADSKVDVIIACRRFDEGTDWKLASHVYNHGLPSSYGLIIQRWGRSFRDKSGIEGYPEVFKKTAKIVFLVPQASSALAVEFEKKTHNMHCLILCFMDSFSTGAQFVGSRSLKQPPKALDGIREEQKKAIPDFKMTTATQLTVEYELSVITEEDRFLDPKTGLPAAPTLAEWKAWVETECPEDLQVAVKSVLGAKLQARGQARERKERDPVADHGEFFEKIVNDPQFRDLTFAPNEGIIAAETEFTGEKVKELSRRLNRSEMVSLAEAFPELALQWHPTKNGTLTPDQVFVAKETS